MTTKNKEIRIEDVATLFDHPNEAIVYLQRAKRNERIIWGRNGTYMTPAQLYHFLDGRERKAPYSARTLGQLLFPNGMLEKPIDVYLQPWHGTAPTGIWTLDDYDRVMK